MARAADRKERNAVFSAERAVVNAKTPAAKSAARAKLKTARAALKTVRNSDSFKTETAEMDREQEERTGAKRAVDKGVKDADTDSAAKVKKLKATRNPDGSLKKKNFHEMTPEEKKNLPANVAREQIKNSKTPAAKKAAEENFSRAVGSPNAPTHSKKFENQK